MLKIGQLGRAIGEGGIKWVHVACRDPNSGTCRSGAAVTVAGSSDQAIAGSIHFPITSPSASLAPLFCLQPQAVNSTTFHIAALLLFHDPSSLPQHFFSSTALSFLRKYRAILTFCVRCFLSFSMDAPPAASLVRDDNVCTPSPMSSVRQPVASPDLRSWASSRAPSRASQRFSPFSRPGERSSASRPITFRRSLAADRMNPRSVPSSPQPSPMC